MTAQDLKNAILQLAAQGKLVPQDPADEPASELLKRIRAEKERLVKEGKIKKEKTLPPITEEETPFEIPENWVWTRLGAYLDVRDGTHDSPKYVQHGFPLVTSKNLKNGVIEMNDIKYITKEDYDAINERSQVNEGDILFAMIGSIGNPSIVGANHEYAIKNVALFKQVFPVNEMYLYYYLIEEQDSMKKKASGGVQPFVSLGYLRNYLLPVPPIAEQQRIVAKIEELMPLVEEYGKAEERLTTLNAEFPDKLRKSILQQAIQGKLTERDPADEPASELLKRIHAEKELLIKEGKIKKEKPLPSITEEEMPFELPDNWEWVRLGNLGETQTGTTPSTKESRYFGKDIPFIKPADIYPDHINYDNEGLSFAGSEQSRIVQAQSVLMVCIGGSIGKTYFNDRVVCCNQQINCITPICCNTIYVWLTLSSNWFFEMLQNVATGTATPIVNKRLWSNIPVSLPPLAEQQRIVDRVNELLALCDKLK